MKNEIEIEEAIDKSLLVWKEHRKTPKAMDQMDHNEFYDYKDAIVKRAGLEKCLFGCPLCELLLVDNACDLCPVKWIKYESYEERGFCEVLDSPYRLWRISKTKKRAAKAIDGIIKKLEEAKEELKRNLKRNLKKKTAR